MESTAYIKSLTQKDYEKLLSVLAAAIRTQRRLITITDSECVNGCMRFTVKRKGAYYPYLVEVSDRGFVKLLGVII